MRVAYPKKKTKTIQVELRANDKHWKWVCAKWWKWVCAKVKWCKRGLQII